MNCSGVNFVNKEHLKHLSSCCCHLVGEWRSCCSTQTSEVWQAEKFNYLELTVQISTTLKILTSRNYIVPGQKLD